MPPIFIAISAIFIAPFAAIPTLFGDPPLILKPPLPPPFLHPFILGGGHRYFYYQLPPIFIAISAIFITLFAAIPALFGDPPPF